MVYLLFQAKKLGIGISNKCPQQKFIIKKVGVIKKIMNTKLPILNLIVILLMKGLNFSNNLYNIIQRFLAEYVAHISSNLITLF